MTTTLAIPDMSCGHCRASIQSALAPLPGVSAIRFDAEARTAEIDGTVPPETLIRALAEIGFPASLTR